MKIEVLYFEDCPHYRPAVDRLRMVLRQEAISVEICEIEIKDAAAADALQFFRSPTIRMVSSSIRWKSCRFLMTSEAMGSRSTVRRAVELLRARSVG